MELSNDLITQFAKISKFNTNKSATTVRGTIVKSKTRSGDNERTYLRIDGAEDGSMTPVETVVEVADGDRVIATVKDHSVVVTGNKTNPSVGKKTADGLRSEIAQEANLIRAEVADDVADIHASITLTADQIRQEVSDEVAGLNSTINQTASAITSTIDGIDDKYSYVKQTVDGLTVETINGKTVIDGGNIKASSLNLSGAITWDNFDDITKANIEGAAADAAEVAISWVEEDIQDVKEDAANAKEIAEEALEYYWNINIPKLPDYITETYIDGARIESPTIIGGQLYAVGSNPNRNSTFTTMDENGYYLYSNATAADTDNTIYPKISMMCSDTVNGRPMIILGAGESDDYVYHNRFIIEKGSTYAWLEYHFDYSYPGCGITFVRDGTVSINGTLAGETGLFPIGYIYLSTDTTSPASLFGGTWSRLSGYFLYATGTNNKVGDASTNYVSTTTSTNSSATYINIAAWERVG